MSLKIKKECHMALRKVYGLINKEYKIPSIYLEMDRRGFISPETFLWLNEMEWIPLNEIYNYEYEDDESKLIIPFAHTGAGDKWVWIVNDENKEYCVGLCENPEITGVYYAKNTEEAILRQIIEYVASSNFYMCKEDAELYQVSEEELKAQLVGWKNRFSGILNDRYIALIEELSQLSLKHIKCQFGEWDALLALEEQDELIEKYIRFDKMDDEFEWFVEE